MIEDVVGNVEPAEGSALPEPSAPNIVTLPDGNAVTLHPEVTMPIGIAAMSVFRSGGSQAVIEANLSEVYLHFGIASWTFTEQGPNGLQPVPITPENVATLLPFQNGGLEVAEAADRLYSETVMRPLLKRVAELSRHTQTGNTTRPVSANGSTPRTPSKRSSRTPTDGKPSSE